MIADLKNGGLNMPDVGCMNMSLGLDWLGRLIEKQTLDPYNTRKFEKVWKTIIIQR